MAFFSGAMLVSGSVDAIDRRHSTFVHPANWPKETLSPNKKKVTWPEAIWESIVDVCDKFSH